MQHSKLKLGLATASTLAVAFTFAAQPALADYAPSSGDVVGVGSDTVQYASDFVADGDTGGDLGINSTGNKYKIINFDATPDANARLAYGPDGASSATCAPGTGSTAGTGNQTSKHTDQPCTLNPTVVLRAGTNPVQRPNGSGGGAAAGATDGNHYISYVRASSAQGSTLNAGTQGNWDSITIGSDPLAMLTATTTNAPLLSAQDLKLIYNCTDTTWSSLPGNSGGSAETIIPIIPQVGSGTRSSFLVAIGITAVVGGKTVAGNPGACVETGEENDPTAIAAATDSNIAGNTDAVPAKDAIEPMSGGRLNLFQGKLGDGSSSGNGGYFKDPSCSLNVIAAASGTSNPTCQSTQNTINPSVNLVTTAGNAADGNPVFNIPRPLYIYFRASDVDSSTPFEPGGKLNFVRTLFYNPCEAGQTGCVTVGGSTFGPGGAPYYDQSGGQALVSAAGILPTYAFTLNGP